MSTKQNKVFDFRDGKDLKTNVTKYAERFLKQPDRLKSSIYSSVFSAYKEEGYLQKEIDKLSVILKSDVSKENIEFVYEGMMLLEQIRSFNYGISDISEENEFYCSLNADQQEALFSIMVVINPTYAAQHLQLAEEDFPDMIKP